jgi:hypothetical protein
MYEGLKEPGISLGHHLLYIAEQGTCRMQQFPVGTWGGYQHDDEQASMN